MSSSHKRNNNNYPWLLPVIGILVVAMIIVAVVAGIRRRDPKPKEIEIDPSDMQAVTDPIVPESEAIVSPHDTIKRFETAFNNGDWEEIGKCVEPSARETYLRQLDKSSGDLEKSDHICPNTVLRSNACNTRPIIRAQTRTSIFSPLK